MNCFSQVFSPNNIPTPSVDVYSNSPKTPQTPLTSANPASCPPGGPHSQGPNPVFPPSGTPDIWQQLIKSPNSVPGANVEHHALVNGNPGSVPAPSPLARQPPTPSTFPPSVGANPLTPQSVGTSQSQLGLAGPTSPLDSKPLHQSQTMTSAAVAAGASNGSSANNLDLNPASLEQPRSIDNDNLSPSDLERIMNGEAVSDDVDVSHSKIYLASCIFNSLACS